MTKIRNLATQGWFSRPVAKVALTVLNTLNVSWLQKVVEKNSPCNLFVNITIGGRHNVEEHQKITMDHESSRLFFSKLIVGIVFEEISNQIKWVVGFILFYWLNTCISP